MKIAVVRAHRIANVPIVPPPFRDVPNKTSAVLLEVVTESGITGWARPGIVHPLMVEFINSYLAPQLAGEDVYHINRIKNRMTRTFGFGSVKGGFGNLFRSAWSAFDIAVWDIKGQHVGKPLHELLGGARDRIPVYITFGVPYNDAPEYSVEELVAEARHWVSMGITKLKTTVGQTVRGHDAHPDAQRDYERLSAVRAAVGPEIKLAVDGAYGMSLPETVQSCKAIEELDIAYIEEPLYENDPQLLAELRRQTRIPVAAAETARYTARHYMVARSIDILQPNVNNDGGYTGGIELAAIARSFNTPIGHGNGSGPHNISLHAGLENGTDVEYHLIRWAEYNAIFKHVPQPENGFLTASTIPGTGLAPKDGLIKEYAARA